ncbi:hypothetical protein MPTK1_3g20795 [Marchantia polymorpha subsp. ruderalis]
MEAAVASNVSSSLGVEERIEGAVASNVSSSVGVEERIEGAVASNVNHAAETRGMDSADEELKTSDMSETDDERELPSAVQYLIRRLEKAKRLPWLPPLTGPDFMEFFPKGEWLSTITGWRSQVRLRVLEAIGSCNTVLDLRMELICGGDISRLMANEWELLLRGFSRSTVLRTIQVERLKWESVGEVESLCLQLGRILQTSSVKYLKIVNCRLSATCFLNLAIGLRGSDESELEYLELRNAWEDLSAVRNMADMITSATRLDTLEIGGSSDRMYDMDEEAARILSQALIQSSSVKKLVLKAVKGEVSAFLLKALDADGGNRAIQCLHLTTVSGLGDSLRELLRSNPYLLEVTLTSIEMRPEQWSQLGQAIRGNATAESIRVVHSMMHHKDGLKGVEELACAASSYFKDPKVELILTFRDYDALMSALNFVGRVLRGQIKSIKSLILFLQCSCPSDSNQIVPMDENPAETTLLKSLKLFVQRMDTLREVWKYLLVLLRDNTSLTHLDLSLSDLDDEAFRDLMDLLQVNTTLQEIDVSCTAWARDGKAALIQEALQQNQKRAGYRAVFTEAGLALGDAKAGRLFLCGSPLAGKTQLRKTLMRIVQGESWLRNRLSNLRTTGIEVEFLEFLQHNERRQISIWDLAGQDIFRTLQNVLFPRTSNFCLFLFVYSPFCEKKSSNKKDSCFQTELEDWMSFISSNIKVDGHNRPQVLVVISHKDKSKIISLTWAESIVNKLSEPFAEYVDIHPIQECFHVDVRKKKQVIPLKNHIFEIFTKLWSEKFPQVPKLCSQLSSLLVTNTKKNRKCPLWRSQKFHEFCVPIFTQFIPSFSVHTDDHSSITSSLTSYLNDIGSIIHIPKPDYIIVDPNWLTNTLLGKLVALGQVFQAQKTGFCTHNSYTSHDSNTSQDGFVSDSVFTWLIKEFLRKQPRRQRGVNREVIEEILINLDLCFKDEDTSQYFIPSFIPENASMEEQKLAWGTRSMKSQFVGIRIQCKDERAMSLTAAFFPCFEMFVRRQLISERRVSKNNITCSRHYLGVFLDGHQIYLEQGTSRKYVDVLMLCSDCKSRELAIKSVMKHIVQKLMSFCASPQGCPGVALVLSVIQTRCVEMLIPSHLRGIILIEELKSNFIRDINEKLEDLTLVKEEDWFSYEHSWDVIGGHTGVISKRARDLLWKSDVEVVVNETRQKRMQQLKSLQQGLVQQLDSLQQGLIEVNNDLNHSHPEKEKMVSSSNFPDMKDSNRPSSRRLRRASTSVENRATQILLERVDQVEKKVDGVDERVKSVQTSVKSVQTILQRLEKKTEQILSLQQELQSTRSDFMSKVDMIIEYSQEFQHTRTPKRPYITDDVGFFYRMSAKLHFGKIVQLHLMCESETGFHMVKDQEGLKIRANLRNRACISKTIDISLKVMYYALKAGLDVTLGLGELIPDLADLKSDTVRLDGISDSDRSAVLKGGESMELKEAWLRIQQTLAPQLRDSYSKIFKLYQVKYVRPELGGHAWVCEECMKKGLRSGSLKLEI